MRTCYEYAKMQFHLEFISSILFALIFFYLLRVLSVVHLDSEFYVAFTRLSPDCLLYDVSFHFSTFPVA